MIKLKPGKSRMAFIAISFAIFSASIITSCKKDDIDPPIGVTTNITNPPATSTGSQSASGTTTA